MSDGANVEAVRAAEESINGAVEPIYMHLTMTDPEVVAAVGEYPAGPARKEFVDLCLKVGVQSVRAARGLVDGEAVRKAGDQLMLVLGERLEGFRENMGGQVGALLSQYFDPASGAFTTRVKSLTEDNGELQRIVRGSVQQETDRLRGMVEGLIGPDGRLTRLLGGGDDNEFVRALRTQVEGVITLQEERVIQQFSLDDEASPLSRLVRELKASHGDLNEAMGRRMAEVTAEFSLDRKDSALNRMVSAITSSQQTFSEQLSLDNPDSALNRMQRLLMGKIEEGQRGNAEFQAQVLASLAAMTARREAERASTTHGAEFELRVGEAMRNIAEPAGDVLEDCGTTTGLIRASKVGDFLLTLSPDAAAAGAKIVIEAKEAGAYTLKSTLAECDEARRNRGAGVCIFVHSKETAPAGMDVLKRYGDDILVVWDAKDDVSDVVLKAALGLAKGLCLRSASHSSEDKASYAAIDKAIEVLRKQLDGFAELKTTGETVERSGVKMQERARIMLKAIGDAVEVIAEQVGRVRQHESGNTQIF